jgi:hypothetical protein
MRTRNLGLLCVHTDNILATSMVYSYLEKLVVTHLHYTHRAIHNRQRLHKRYNK